jgi:hypothetical protein
LYGEPPHAPRDRVLKEVTQQPKKVYNAPDVYGVTSVKALDALTQTIDND